MYLDFYAFKSKPFSLLPDPDYLFLSSKHKAALEHLDYGLTDQTGFILIIGDVGTGKTTLLKYLVRNLDEHVQTALIFNTRVSSLELLRMVLREFDLDEDKKHKGQCYRTLYDFFLKQYALGNQCLLIIDEAQNLPPQTLEEVRMLSNLNEGDENLFQVILAGQPPLKIKLERKDMRQFVQRVTMDFVLEPLEENEIRDYIRHRMRKAGREERKDIFTLQAYERIYELTRGIPRLINVLCDGSLVYGFADGLREIDAGVINEVVKDKKIKGQFFENEPAAVLTVKGQTKGASVGKLSALSRRVEHLEKKFKELEDLKNDQTIQELEKLLAGQTERSRQAARECGEKDLIIKSLKQRIGQLEERLRTQWQDRAKQRTQEP